MSNKILIVEDITDTRELLHLYFTNAGFVVATATDGGEGIYMANSELPDIILTDLSMPNMSGVEMIKHLRSQLETAKVPILVFTAYGSGTTEQAIEAGATQAFYKPFDFDELVEVVHQLLENSNESN
jgi:DNA-binding response OmpR family regulator